MSGLTQLRESNGKESILQAHTCIPFVFTIAFWKIAFSTTAMPGLADVASTFKKCTFRQADLRDASLGAVDGEVRNVFVDVDFTDADMRGTMHTSAECSRCFFNNSKLVKVDFQGSVFTDCVFQGKLDGVLFYDQGFNGKHLSKNELLRTDCSLAQFRLVEFRRLNLETVRFPNDDDHIRVEDNFPKLLARILSALAGKENLASRQLAAIIRNEQKWLGPTQRRGVISKQDVMRAGGQQGWDLSLSLLHTPN